MNFWDKKINAALWIFSGDGPAADSRVFDFFPGFTDKGETFHIWAQNKDMIREADIDGDGQVSYEEFVIMMKKK